MTGNTNKKLRGLFLAMLMIVSVFAGSIALTGTAGAAVGNQASAVVLGSGDQSLGSPLNVTEDSDGEWGSSGTGAIELPDGVTWNQTSSDLNVRQVSSGQLSNVQFASSQKITFDYSGFDTTANTSIKFGQLNVAVSPDVGESLTAEMRVGTDTQDISFWTDSPTVSTTTKTVGAGSEGISLNSVDVTTDANLSGQVAAGTDIVLSINDTATGVTFDTSQNQSDLTLTKPASTGDVNETAVTISESQVVIPVNETFGADQTLTVDGLAVNATVSATNAKLNLTTTPTNAVGDVETQTSSEVDITKPQLTLGQSSYVADGRTSDEIEGTITITSSADYDIGNQTNVTIELNDSAVTFDTSQSAPTPQLSQSGTGDGGTDESVGPLEINENNVTFSVTDTGDEGLEQGDSVSISGLLVNVSESAAAEGDQIELKSYAQSGPSAPVVTDTTSTLITVTNPTGTFNEGNNFTLYVGDTGNDSVPVPATKDLEFSEDTSGTTDLSPNSDNNVTISLESGTGVTIDDSQTSLSVASTSGVTVSSTQIVDEKTINVTVSGASDGVTDSFALSGLHLNASDSATNTTVSYAVNTTDVSVDAGEIVVTEPAPVTADINGGSDLAVSLDDNDPATGIAESDIGLSSDDVSVNFPVGDDVPSSDFNITVKLPDNGFTFDQDGSTTLTPVYSGTASSTTATIVDDHTINVTVIGPNQPDGASVTLNGVELNATESATNTTPTISINGSSPIDNRATDHKIVPSELSVDEIRGDDDATTDGIPGENDLDGTSFSIDTNPTLLVQALNSSSAFSGADISLSINDTSADASVTPTSVTTNESGYAAFDFDPGTAAGATYNITATTGDVTQNFTVDVTAGAATQLNATHVSDAVATDGDGTNQPAEMATIRVDVEDDGGNHVTSSTDVTVDSIGMNVTGTIVGASDADDHNVTNDAADFSGSSGTVTASDGTFYVYVTRSTGTTDAKVSLTSSSLGTATSTTTIYSGVHQLDVALENKSQPLIAGQTVNVSYTPLDDAGTAITVSGLEVNPSSTNQTVIQRESSTVATTNAEGVAYKNFTIKNKGTATLQGVEQRSSILGELAVEVDQPTLVVTVNETQIYAGETTDVRAHVAYASNSSDVDAATVNMTGAGVAVEDTTAADGNVTFSVSPTETGTIAVNATKTDTNMDSTEITVEKQEVQLNLTANETTVVEGDTVQFELTNNETDAAMNGTVVVNGTEYDTGDDGVVDVTFDQDGSYTATGQKESTNTTDYLDDTEDITVQQPATFDVSYTVDSTTVQPDEDVTVTATVDNTGDLSGSTTVWFYADGEEFYNESVTVDGGNSTDVAATTSFATTGTHNVTVNDLEATDITVQEAGQANFSITAFDVPAEVAENETFDATVDVENIGEQAGTQTVTLEVGDDSLEESISLDAGENTSVTFDLQAPIDDNDQPDDAVFTASTANDSATATTTVYELGDVDHDGEVSPSDVTKTQRYIVGLDIDGTFDTDAADIDSSGDIGPADVTLIQRIIVGLPI